MSAEQPLRRKLWEHHDPKSTQMWHFLQSMEEKAGIALPSFDALYRYSIDNISDFWRHTFNYFPIVYSGKVPSKVVDEAARLDSIPKWFQGTKLNFAENILFLRDENGKRTTSPEKEDDKIACTEVREGVFMEPIRSATWQELRHRVGRMQQAMKAYGIGKGDRVATVSGHSLDTLTVFLAVSALGSIFSSSSTDMGTKGILDRLTQIRPKLLFMDDYACYNGKTIDLRSKMAEIVDGLRDVKEFHGVVAQPRWSHKPADMSMIRRCTTLSHFLSAAMSANLEFAQLDFSDPLVIVYSSGTTGQPKCIVHGVGGVILNGHKEDRLHRQIDANSSQLQYTATGWIMYLGAIQALLTGARMIMYDGSPFVPDATSLLRLAEHEKATHLSISPRWLRTLQSQSIIPKKVFNLESLRVLTCTGMVLPDDLAEWVYDVAFPLGVQLDNITGGTDIAGCFGCANPISPLYVGGCQGRSLGIDVCVYDWTIEGGPGVTGMLERDGTPGELICRKPFPTMPIVFWEGKQGALKYFNSYFAKYDNVWTHGDFVMIDPQTKQLILLGRADGVLNPSGVRFGSSEIYSVIDEKFADAVADSICVGQRRPQDDDESVMLFLLMKPGVRLTPALVKAIKDAIRAERTPRHVPRYIFETPEIPTTINLKKVELPVKQIVSGKTIKPSSTLSNPECLQFYYQFAKDERLVQLELSNL